MDAITLLREDHVKVLAMLDELERGPVSGRSAAPEDNAARKRLVTELVMAESAHEAIEEQFFWPSVQHWLKEGRQLAGPALEQEQAAKRVLQELDKLEPGDSGFEILLRRVIAEAREHIAYEEREVWPVAQRLAPSELEELGKKMAIAKKAAPTRPHPNTPPSQACSKQLGWPQPWSTRCETRRPVAARTDTARHRKMPGSLLGCGNHRLGDRRNRFPGAAKVCGNPVHHHGQQASRSREQ